MDFGDDDLFAVFDSESSKTKRSAIASDIVEEEGEDAEPEKPIRFDAGRLAAEITPGKRSKSDCDEEPLKKMKKDEGGRTLMTGLTDRDVDENLGGGRGEQDVEMVNDGEDENEDEGRKFFMRTH